ncbi:hypothetical protein [Streptomyces sp. NBC_00989]|uniref:hypothetical protein n=1 Tax=Streptomyces sp. NBC_00989 TaxID=2903705 RepID=UPI0038691B0E|nr:hypothetical protein OG714_03940 [Streptomyces sp. NBC_00989]
MDLLALRPAAAVIGVVFAATHQWREAPVRPANVPSVSPSPDVTTAVPEGPGAVDAVPSP